LRLLAKCWKSEKESKDKSSLTGKIAITDSPLNPYGTAVIDGEVMEVQTDGEAVDSGRGVRIIRVSGKKIYVKKV